MTARLARLNVTPVKGMALAHPAAVELTAAGIPANRLFFLVNEAGTLYTAGDHGPLVRLQPQYDPIAETLGVAFPDGTVVVGAADRLGRAHVTDMWGRPVPGRILEGSLAEAVSAYVGRPLDVVRADAEGDGPDVHRLTLMALASVRDLGSRHGRPGLDPLRFRMNLELDGCDPYEEDSWTGRQVRVGAAVVRVLGQVPRCVLTTRDPVAGLKDFDTLKAISAYRPLMEESRGVPFGMYAEVEVPGRIAVGDPVEPLEPVSS